MGYMATWGPKGFIVSSRKIVVLEGLATSLSLKQDSENDTSGTQTTNTRGRELRPITFKVKYLAAAGVDPRGQINEWEAQLGNAYPLYIGGQRFGAEKMKLTKVDTSDILLSNAGKFLQATVSITLEEFSEGKTSALVSSNTTANTTGGTSGASTPSASTNTVTYATSSVSAGRKAARQAEKKAALNATASKSDRAGKSPVANKKSTLN